MQTLRDLNGHARYIRTNMMQRLINTYNTMSDGSLRIENNEGGESIEKTPNDINTEDEEKYMNNMKELNEEISYDFSARIMLGWLRSQAH